MTKTSLELIKKVLDMIKDEIVAGICPIRLVCVQKCTQLKEFIDYYATQTTTGLT